MSFKGFFFFFLFVFSIFSSDGPFVQQSRTILAILVNWGGEGGGGAGGGGGE